MNEVIKSIAVGGCFFGLLLGLVWTAQNQPKVFGVLLLLFGCWLLGASLRRMKDHY